MTPVVPDSGWNVAQEGLEQRIFNFIEGGQQVEHILLLRVDPARFSFRVAYDPLEPPGLPGWQERTGARIVLNGGYFRVEDEQYLANGLTVVDGQAFGQSYGDYAGMFTVSGDLPDLRWLRARPLLGGEGFTYALQSFPMLVRPGGVLGFPAELEDNMRARRTVIGRDVAGRYLLMVTAYPYFTLHRLSAWLVDSDLQLDVALNLDGGPSSGLLLQGSSESILSVNRLPVVITVFER